MKTEIRKAMPWLGLSTWLKRRQPVAVPGSELAAMLIAEALAVGNGGRGAVT